MRGAKSDVKQQDSSRAILRNHADYLPENQLQNVDLNRPNGVNYGLNRPSDSKSANFRPKSLFGDCGVFYEALNAIVFATQM